MSVKRSVLQVVALAMTVYLAVRGASWLWGIAGLVVAVDVFRSGLAMSEEAHGREIQ